MMCRMQKNDQSCYLMGTKVTIQVRMCDEYQIDQYVIEQVPTKMSTIQSV